MSLKIPTFSLSFPYDLTFDASAGKSRLARAVAATEVFKKFLLSILALYNVLAVVGHYERPGVRGAEMEPDVGEIDVVGVPDVEAGCREAVSESPVLRIGFL